MTTVKTTRDPQISDYLVRVLTNVGLSENQACVYLACLKLGTASIWDISLISGVKRTTCYVVMGDLISRGLASTSEDSKKSLYSVVTPNELFFNLKIKQNQLAESMGELNALTSKSHARPHVRMFEGASGVEQAYKLTLNLPEGEEILIYGTPTIYLNYQEMINEYVKQRVEGKIKVRALIADTPLGREVIEEDEKILRKVRLFSKEIFDQQTEINILPDSIIYIAHSEEEPFATVIENSTLAREEKNRFELLWNIAKDPSPAQ